MKIAFLESFYGGSHKNFLDGLIKYSSHKIEPFVLPARFWKWRLRCAALYFAEHLEELIENFDLVVASDMMNLAEFKSLSGYTGPTIHFFHENQLTYPLPKDDKLEFHFGFVNLVSALVADLNLFNSDYQRKRFEEACPNFINKIPEFVPSNTLQRITQKSRVIHMGCDFDWFPDVAPPQTEVPAILWNHRWEFDKQPEIFFRALFKLLEQGIDFKLIIMGENFQVRPQEFLEARERLGKHIVQFGFVEALEDYADFLKMSDIIISTAVQENFGYSVIEAMYCHTLPLLPNDLSYPEILEKKFHRQFLYKDEDDLHAKLLHFVKHYREYDETRAQLSKSIARFHWKKRIAEFDRVFEEVAGKIT
jgi:glycosyltransferase involved in cell wall biosynthesis